MKRTRKRLNRVLLWTLVVLATMVVALAVAKAWWDAHYYDGYDQGLPLNVELRRELKWPAYQRIELTFEGLPGEPVPTLLARPRQGDGPFPCAIFLHGIGQKKEFLDEIAEPFVKSGFAIVSFDQYTRGERRLKEATALQKAFALRRRAALVVIETRRLIDYLHTRGDIAHDRIYLVGASFGAITGSTAAAFDERIAATVLVYGGGDLPLLFAGEAASKELRIWRRPMARFLAFLLAPADPIKHVRGIAPRPVLFQNGTQDSLIPTAAAQALFDAAEEPKEIIWYDSDHVGLDPGHTEQVLKDAIAWLKMQDGKTAACPVPTALPWAVLAQPFRLL